MSSRDTAPSKCVLIYTQHFNDSARLYNQVIHIEKEDNNGYLTLGYGDLVTKGNVDTSDRQTKLNY